jgi:hypothetical protein
MDTVQGALPEKGECRARDRSCEVRECPVTLPLQTRVPRRRSETKPRRVWQRPCVGGQKPLKWLSGAGLRVYHCRKDGVDVISEDSGSGEVTRGQRCVVKTRSVALAACRGLRMTSRVDGQALQGGAACPQLLPSAHSGA